MPHYTAASSASGAISWLTNPASKVSAHLVVARDGSTTQLVPFDRIAWHAGESAWAGVTGLNRHSIGIELDYPGPAPRGTLQGAVMRVGHKHGGPVMDWPSYSQQQLDACAEVAAALVAAYRLVDVVGHDDIAPGRKQDPGPAFPMEAFRARVASPVGAAPPAGAGAVPRIIVPGA